MRTKVVVRIFEAIFEKSLRKCSTRSSRKSILGNFRQRGVHLVIPFLHPSLSRLATRNITFLDCSWPESSPRQALLRPPYNCITATTVLRKQQLGHGMSNIRPLPAKNYCRSELGFSCHPAKCLISGNQHVTLPQQAIHRVQVSYCLDIPRR